jgi:3-hydroxyisobutyrate dehydrogenase-like beta-hydroxyacid dehydrogenase
MTTLAKTTNSLSGWTIGFVGLGKMGFPMARHLAAAGARVIAWNRSEEPLGRASEFGIERAHSLPDLARQVGSGVICLNLTTTDVVLEVVSGDHGLLPHASRETLFIDFGTTGVEATRAFSQRALWLDAPVSGGEVGAEGATLSIMVGGKDDAFRRALPIFETVGKRVTYMGASGAGQVTKLANQLIVAQTIDAVAQALRLAELAGVSSERVREALMGGFADSRILQLHGDRMVRRDFRPGGRAEWQLKDVRLICELAHQVGLHSESLDHCRSLWEHFVVEEGNGDLDHSGLFLHYLRSESQSSSDRAIDP